ncbi:hypothetical protein F5888DRAFT_1334090 [Russula emetica]|nr:hypothetical protein F5888DRAFT_1334090 [Russula emetica]
MPATLVLWPRNGVGLPNRPKMAPPQCTRFSPQDGQLTLRLASACALQVIWVALVRHLSWQPIRPALVLGCLSSRGPLGLALGFYRARVRRLDVAHFCNQAWQERSPATFPCFARVLSNVVRRLRACGTLCGIVSLGLQIAFKVTAAQGANRKMKRFWGDSLLAVSLSALGKINFCSPSSRRIKIDVRIGVNGVRTGSRVEEHANTIIGEGLHA